MKMKKLNNKGFTLIELLAVVVILAVVMGIAMTSVLSAMNKSRGGSLADSAMVIATGFNQKYTESLVDGVPSNVYGDVLDTGSGTNIVQNGYKFQSTVLYYLDKGLADSFNISEDGYAFANSTTATNSDAIASVDPNVDDGLANSSSISNSIVYFDATSGKFTVCLFANKTGSYFVDNYKVKTGSTTAIELGDADPIPAVGTMYACSDGQKSW